jgi:hypothetical protein
MIDDRSETQYNFTCVAECIDADNNDLGCDVYRKVNMKTFHLIYDVCDIMW